MKPFKKFIEEQNSSENKKEKRIAIHVSFGHHIEQHEKINENVENEQIQNDLINPHSDEEIKSFHAKNKLNDTMLPPSEARDHFGWFRNYTDRSLELHKALWDDHHGVSHENDYDKKMHDRNLAFADATSKTFDKNKPTSQDFTVFSGINQNEAEKFKNQKALVKVHHPSMISTSTNFDQAAKFTGGNKKAPTEKHVLRLFVPKGTKAGSIRHVSRYKKENEVLLDRGHDLDIHPEPTIINHPVHGKVHIWHARVVGQNRKTLNTKPLKDVLSKDQLPV